MNDFHGSALTRGSLIGLCWLFFVGMVVGAGNASQVPSPDDVREISATVETQPVPHGGDAADDIAIWVHPTRPADGTIIGTDKQGGLAVYNLAGEQLQNMPDGKMNNVDLRADFPLGGQKVALVTAGNRTDNSIAIYRVNPASRRLENVAARKITTLEVYGSCMYRSQKTGTFYYFVNSRLGEVEQWELYDNGSGRVDGKKVRRFTLDSQTEGCVADDELGHFYIAEEKVGIWKYGAEPDAGPSRRQVDQAGPGGHLVPDVEGLTIAYQRHGTGYLIASSQGNSTYVVYRREGDNPYVRTFRIVDGNGIDGTSDTDGIDATTANLGPAFPHGVFVAQDGMNDNGNQNFKLVPLQLITGHAVVASETCGRASSTASLTFKEGRARFDADPDDTKLALQGSFVAPVGSIDPPRQGVTVGIRHGATLIGCFVIPPEGEGWTTSRGPKWEFRAGSDPSDDDEARQKVKIKFDAEKKRFELKVKIRRAELMEPEFSMGAGVERLSTSVIIGDAEFLNAQQWRATAGGAKLITP